MCGIAGVFGLEPARATEVVRRATDRLAHRGPDDSGDCVVLLGTAALALGHRRLAILDLSPLGHQPMVCPRTGAAIVFNGEIYNFLSLRRELEAAGVPVTSTSDTAVVLAGLVHHGASFLERLEGMFALAFAEPGQKRVLLARDPAGIKPLYLMRTAQAWAFASETRALLAMGLAPPRLSRSGVASYLAYGAVQHPETVFEGIHSLPPGSVLELGPDLLTSRVSEANPRFFWRLPPARPEIPLSDAIAQTREAVDAAVSDHLIADVPVSVFLSSGIDSSLIAALAARHQPNIASFTVSFGDQRDFSEHSVAARTAQRWGLKHTEIPLPMAVAEAMLPRWLASLDQPSIDGLNVFAISQAVREQGFKVALSGLGSDELFAGYPSFQDVPRLQRLHRTSARIPGARQVLSLAYRWRTSRAQAGKLTDMLASDGSCQSLYLHRRRVLTNAQLKSLGISTEEMGPDFLPAGALRDVDSSADDPVRLVSQLEFRLYEGNMLLRDADVCGMAHGLEIRVPFLDQRLLNLAHSLPGQVRLPQGAPGKFLLRQAFADLLPSEVTQQPKRGFTLPIRRWMQGAWRPACEQALTALKDRGVVRPDGVDAIWHDFLREPESPMWSRALALIVLGEFCRRTLT